MLKSTKNNIHLWVKKNNKIAIKSYSKGSFEVEENHY